MTHWTISSIFRKGKAVKFVTEYLLPLSPSSGHFKLFILCNLGTKWPRDIKWIACTFLGGKEFTAKDKWRRIHPSLLHAIWPRSLRTISLVPALSLKWNLLWTEWKRNQTETGREWLGWIASRNSIISSILLCFWQQMIGHGIEQFARVKLVRTNKMGPFVPCQMEFACAICFLCVPLWVGLANVSE